MSADRAFFDSNVLLYVISDDPAKIRRSQEILLPGGVISVQVLNEFANVARRKYRHDLRSIRTVLTDFRATLRVVPLTEATHDLGLELAERYSHSVYDSMIVAAARLAGCTTLFSEDMQDGLLIGDLTIRNPYA